MKAAVSLSGLGIRTLLLDIEGTTTPIAFVYEVLFPYARAHGAEFLAREGESAACQWAVSQLAIEQAADRARGEAPPSATVDYVGWLMDRDRKSPGLKALQGLIWRNGYGAGELRGQVYPDVPPALERWRSGGRDVYIYSSGSVLAQQLLFGSTAEGDLTRLLTGYFDTAVGLKTSPESYAAIAQRIGGAARELLFVSDVTKELDAARAAGLRTALCVRAAEPTDAGDHPVIHSFEEIDD